MAIDNGAELDDVVAELAGLLAGRRLGSTAEARPDGRRAGRGCGSAAWELFDRGEILLVVGSSLTVYSGFRFVRRAGERNVPVAVVNVGPTRADDLVQAKVAAPAGEVLPRLARALGVACG